MLKGTIQHRYEIPLSSTSHDPKRMESSVRRMLERRVEGVAVLTFGMEELLLEYLPILIFIGVAAVMGAARSEHYSATKGAQVAFTRALSQALAGHGVETFAVDMRGHGTSGTRGDIGYVGQLEDDLADFGPGGLIVDVSCDEGMGFSWARPTTRWAFRTGSPRSPRSSSAPASARGS